MNSGKNLLIVLLPVFLFINSCSVLEPVAPGASYIHIDSIPVFVSDTTPQGSNSSRVTDAWVLLDNVLLGTFPLPADIPLIGEGEHKITVRAGIIENGISGTRSAYPKYTSYDTTVSLSSTEKRTITPVVTYVQSTVIPQIEDSMMRVSRCYVRIRTMHSVHHSYR